MPTSRQKKAFKELLKNDNRKEAMLKANYSPNYAKSGQILQKKGWKELMEQYLPDNDLARVHQEGLNAVKSDEPDYPTRHRYLETAYKIKGRLKDWEGGEERPLNQNILILIKKVYGKRGGDSTNASSGEEIELPGGSS